MLDRSDPPSNYVSVCFVLIIVSSLFLSQARLLSCLSLIIAGVVDKTKTKEFQVAYVTFLKLNFMPHKIPDGTAVLLFYSVFSLFTRGLCISACGGSFARAGNDHPSERRWVFLCVCVCDCINSLFFIWSPYAIITRSPTEPKIRFRGLNVSTSIYSKICVAPM